MIELPINNLWTVPNTSDKFGSLWATRNFNLDELGYATLSPRSIRVFSEDSSGGTNFNFATAFGRYNDDSFYITTVDEPFIGAYADDSDYSTAEDTSTDNPNCTFDSHGVWWQGRWYVTTATSANYYNGSAWSTTAVSLTSGVMHYMSVFENRQTLCITNGNTVRQVDTAHSTSGLAQLTIPSDYEAISMAYNNNRMGILTGLGDSGSGTNKEAMFFVWDGATSSANTGVPIGSDQGIGVVAYKSSWIIVTRTGEVKYFNGSGFDTVAVFPYFNMNVISGDSTNRHIFGDFMSVDGDAIYFNMSFDLNNSIGKTQQNFIENNPSGIWCWDPKVGLYHRYSPSVTDAAVYSVSSVNTSTNEITFASSVVPATGTEIVYTSASTAIGGLKDGYRYFSIKISGTVMKVATTKANALLGTAVDLTSSGSGSTFLLPVSFYDYGATHMDRVGAIGSFGRLAKGHENLIFSGDYNLATSDDNKDALCILSPFLTSTGHLISPKVFSSGIDEKWQEIYLYHTPLKTGEEIKIKYRNRIVEGLPSFVPNLSGVVANSPATWTSTTTFTTSSDLADVKNYFDTKSSVEDLEVEIVAGAGGGQTTRVTAISEASGVYTVTVADALDGVANTYVSHILFNTWKVIHTANSSSLTNARGYSIARIDTVSTWIQFKIEVKGVGVKIERARINNQPHKTQ